MSTQADGQDSVPAALDWTTGLATACQLACCKWGFLAHGVGGWGRCSSKQQTSHDSGSVFFKLLRRKKNKQNILIN